MPSNPFRIRRAATSVTTTLAAAFFIVAGASVATFVGVLPARAQDDARPALAPGTVQKIRGITQWRRAVWTLDKAQFQLASRDFFTARQVQAQAKAPDHTTVYLLGLSIALAGNGAEAREFIEEASRMAPRFAGNLLAGEIMTAAALAPDDKAGNIAAAAALDEYLVALSGYGRDQAFAAELEFLGYVQRGLRLYRAEIYDRAIADFERAAELAKAQERLAAPELIRTLALCRQAVREYDAARNLISEALRRDPGEPSHYYVMGQLAADNYIFGTSTEWYERAAVRKRDYPEPRLKLAYLAGEAGDLWKMRAQLESFQVLTEVELGAPLFGDGSDRIPKSLVSRRDSARVNVLSGYGSYWRGRAERLENAGDQAGARAMYARAIESQRKALEIAPGCVRSLNALIQMLHLTGAPDSELDLWGQRLDAIMKGAPGAPKTVGETFC